MIVCFTCLSGAAGNVSSANYPGKVSFPPEFSGAVTDFACGSSHSAAIDSEGKLFTWGWNGSFWAGAGALGLGRSCQGLQKTPQFVRKVREQTAIIPISHLGEQKRTKRKVNSNPRSLYLVLMNSYINI